MRIRYVTTVAGPGGVFHAGHEVEVSEDHGRLLVKQRAAIEVKADAAAAPVATVAQIETAEAPNAAAAPELEAPQRHGKPAARARG
jgi:hypothetical protein